MKRKVSAKILDKNQKPTGELVDVTEGVKAYIKINEKNYHYAYDKCCYIEDEKIGDFIDDDDIPF